MPFVPLIFPKTLDFIFFKVRKCTSTSGTSVHPPAPSPSTFGVGVRGQRQSNPTHTTTGHPRTCPISTTNTILRCPVTGGRTTDDQRQRRDRPSAGKWRLDTPSLHYRQTTQMEGGRIAPTNTPRKNGRNSCQYWGWLNQDTQFGPRKGVTAHPRWGNGGRDGCPTPPYITRKW